MLSNQVPSLRLAPSGVGYVLGGARAKVEDVDEKQGLVKGYFSAFGNVDSYGEIIRRGAFTKTIMEWGPVGRGRIAHLVNHDPTVRIGVIRELAEDNHGLSFLSKILPAPHQAGVDALVEYSEGAIREHSIGFDVIKYEIVPDKNGAPDRFELTELRLYEGSAVTWGANMETPVLEVKSPIELASYGTEIRDRIAVLRRCADRPITDDFGRRLDDEISKLENDLREVRTALRAAQGTREPQTDTEILAQFLTAFTAP